MIETKEDLLRVMREHGACDSATRWVHSQTGTAGDIWASCKRVDWLLWFAARLRPATARQFSCWCADRAVRTYAADALDRAGIAHGLRSLAPIVDAQTARAAAARADAYSAAAYASYYAARADAYSAAAYADAARAAAYAAAYAATSAADADDERARQLGALHRLWPRLDNKR